MNLQHFRVKMKKIHETYLLLLWLKTNTEMIEIQQINPFRGFFCKANLFKSQLSICFPSFAVGRTFDQFKFYVCAFSKALLMSIRALVSFFKEIHFYEVSSWSYVTQTSGLHCIQYYFYQVSSWPYLTQSSGLRFIQYYFY